MRKRGLPESMYFARGIIDPNNDKNYYIFGGKSSNQCWKYDNESQKYIEFGIALVLSVVLSGVSTHFEPSNCGLRLNSALNDM